MSSTSSNTTSTTSTTNTILRNLMVGVIILVFGLTILAIIIILHQVVVGLVILIVSLQMFLLDARIRPFWLEVEFASLCLFAFALSLATSPAQGTPTTTPLGVVNATFRLPPDKIQSDLTTLHDKSNALLLLISEHEVQRYMVFVDDIQGVSNTDHYPPYNRDAVKVHVSLLPGVDTNGYMAATFAQQLMNVNAIYVFPLPTPPMSNSTLLIKNPTFILHDKIASDLSVLLSNEKVVLLLVVDRQVYRYAATLKQVRDKAGRALHAPYSNESADDVSVRLEQDTEDAIDDFVDQLANATAIYIMPAR